jgi:hypothetical protein
MLIIRNRNIITVIIIIVNPGTLNRLDQNPPSGVPDTKTFATPLRVWTRLLAMLCPLAFLQCFSPKVAHRDGDILTARRRFRIIADMDRFSSRSDLKRMTQIRHRECTATFGIMLSSETLRANHSSRFNLGPLSLLRNAAKRGDHPGECFTLRN